MKKNIVILGSTGSIGKNLLKIIYKNKSRINIELLSADKNYKQLFKQAKIFNVKNLIITNPNIYKYISKKKNYKRYKIYNNFNSLSKILKKKIDYTMSAISGINGLEPTLKIIKFTKSIAIANKESIVCAWNLIQKELKIYDTKFIPVDSEHFSIWYAIKNNNVETIDNIILTASGGPLLNISKKEIKNVSYNSILKHPTWSMGKKITVDSATLMNKVFEIIEAKNIFNIPYKKLSIMIHPNSYIHSIIKFSNGMIKIVAHETTMLIPLGNSLFENFVFKKKQSHNMTVKTLNDLKFENLNYSKFPLSKIIKYLPSKISLFETVLVSANDTLVDLFLKKKINFNDIQKKMVKLIQYKNLIKFKTRKPKNLNEIILINKKIKDFIYSQYI